jgi:hypothetical protein
MNSPLFACHIEFHPSADRVTRGVLDVFFVSGPEGLAGSDGSGSRDL